jgi:2-keto-4-pentenoate hydratase/2-oxohepta-3-ene-1,7-dioic acid hydratase in catechol pathway
VKFGLATILERDVPAVAVVVEHRIHGLPEATSMLAVLADWQRWVERLDRETDRGSYSSGKSLDDTTFLPPVTRPANLFMAGANYIDHLREMRRDPSLEPTKSPTGPFMFLKPTTTVIGHRSPLKLPEGVRNVDWEIELAAVIGPPARNVSPDRAREHIAAYTILNDISAREGWERKNAPPMFTWDWLLQKGRDGFCPLGPWLTPAAFVDDPHALQLRLSVNGEVQQDSNTAHMIFSTEEQVAYLSQLLTLVPGDVIGTGTCAGVGAGKGRFLKPGDLISAEINGLGVLETPVEA